MIWAHILDCDLGPSILGSLQYNKKIYQIKYSWVNQNRIPKLGYCNIDFLMVKMH